MNLSLQNFSTLVEGMAASVQGAARALVDLSVGSVLRVLLEANASVALWLQWLIVRILASTRLATSTGSDCDSFCADFGFFRLPAVSATGVVTFSRFATTASVSVPVGTVVATAAYANGFTVVADQGNPAFDAGAGAYVIGAGVAGVDVPVTANVAGAGGNVQAGTVTLIKSALPGVDTVVNAAAFGGGVDAESDAAFRARFANYLVSLSKATASAVGAAVMNVQQGLSYTISENIDQAGAAQIGHFVITIDDGTGAPPASLLQNIREVVETVRPVGTSFAVQAASVTPADVALTLGLASGVSATLVAPAVSDAVTRYIASLPVGEMLSFTRLAQAAYAASNAVTYVSDLSLNGGTSDLMPASFGVIRPGTVTVS